MGETNYMKLMQNYKRLVSGEKQKFLSLFSMPVTSYNPKNGKVIEVKFYGIDENRNNSTEYHLYLTPEDVPQLEHAVAALKYCWEETV